LNRYLLDTNHLSGYLDRHPVLQPRVDAALRGGDRFGICLPIHCEYRAGIRVSRRYRQNLARFQTALGIFRLWPTDEDTAAEFAEIFRELRAAGRMLAQFDLLIAAVARQYTLILLTADQDFQPVSRLQIENCS
jgi:predicted nucleic acid-binding protein